MSRSTRVVFSLLCLSWLSTLPARPQSAACVVPFFAEIVDGGTCPSTQDPRPPDLQWSATIRCFSSCGTLVWERDFGWSRATGECLGSVACAPRYIVRNQTFVFNGLGQWATLAENSIASGACLPSSQVKTSTECLCPTCGHNGDPFGQDGEDPLMFSLRDDTLKLTSREGGVRFDLNVDQVAERTAWSAPGSDEAFLVLDRNANGTIDNGLEVFGDATPQFPSDEPNGFRALQVFDDSLNGGNEDGWIDALDRIYFELQLWVDANHDGLSQPEELSGLRSAGIEGIDLAYEKSTDLDEHGNALRYFTQVRRSGEGAVVAWNVFFAQR